MRKYNKYIKGENIKSLDELYKQEMVFHRNNLYHCGWFYGWQLRYTKMQLDGNNIFYAIKMT